MAGTFMDKSFSVHLASDKSYRDNWDRIFKQKAPEAEAPEPVHGTEKCPNGADRCNMCDSSVELLECGCTTHAFGCLSRRFG